MTEAKKEYNRRKAKEHYWANREKHVEYHTRRYHEKLKVDPEWREKRRIWSKQHYADNAEKYRAQHREYYIKNRSKLLVGSRIGHYRKKYGITIAERDALFAANNGLCHICSKRPSEVVDHDHDTGRVRGALCHPCNRMLGAVCDDPIVLLAGADYLRRETCVIS